MQKITNMIMSKPLWKRKRVQWFWCVVLGSQALLDSEVAFNYIMYVCECWTPEKTQPNVPAFIFRPAFISASFLGILNITSNFFMWFHRKRTEEMLREARREQVKNKEHFLAVQAARDRVEFERVLK